MLQIRRRERVVDDDQAAEFMDDPAHRVDVDDGEKRVGGGLQPDHAGGRGPGGGDTRRVGQVDGGGRHPTAGVDFVDEPEGAAVRVVAEQQVVAGLQVAEHGILGSQPAGEGERPGCAFEAGHARFVGVAGGVAGAGVLVAEAGFTDAVLGEGGGEGDRGDDAAGAGIVGLSGPDGSGGEPVVVGVFEAGRQRITTETVLAGRAGDGHVRSPPVRGVRARRFGK